VRPDDTTIVKPAAVDGYGDSTVWSAFSSLEAAGLQARRGPRRSGSQLRRDNVVV
jgi:hypothetical protein